MEALTLATAEAEASLKDKDDVAQRENVKLAQIVVSGGASKASVQNVAKKNIGEIKACYQQALQKQPGARGKLVIKLAIEASGFVTQVSVVANPFSDQTLVACLTQKLKQWRFANVRAPGEVAITYELMP
jgi:hypothetical protein